MFIFIKSLSEFRESRVLEVILDTHADGNRLSVITTSLGGYYSFSLLGNINKEVD